MTWVALYVGMLLVTCIVVASAVFALRMLQMCSTVSQQFIDAHKATLETLERTHDRNVAQNQGVLDRFMALDIHTFKSYQMAETSDEGGFVDPDEEGGSVSFTPNGFEIPHGVSVSERLKQAVEEATILAEDFPEGWDER